MYFRSTEPRGNLAEDEVEVHRVRGDRHVLSFQLSGCKDSYTLHGPVE